MALSSFVGSFSTGTPLITQTVVVTGVGFQPKVVIFWHSGRSESTDAIGRATTKRGFAIATSTTNRRALSSVSVDASADSTTSHAHSDVACIISNTGASIDGSLDLQSFDSDGFTLVCDSATWPADRRIHFLALGGTTLTNANLVSFQEPAATGTQDITGFGFNPTAVLFFGISLTSAPPDGAFTSNMFLGAVTASGQATWGGGSDTGAANMRTGNYCNDIECIGILADNPTAVRARASFDSFITDGVRINWAERSSTTRIFALGLLGGNYRVDSLLTQTNTTTDIVETGFGFQPAAALFVSHGNSESASDTRQTDDRLSIGAFSGVSTRGAQGTLDENGVATSEVTTAIEFDEVYVNIKADSTVDGLMDIKSIDSDGFTCIMDDADPAQAFVWYMAFGEVAAGTNISVSDTITLSESTTQNLVALVKPSETITLSEVINQTLVDNVSVSDTVTLSESVAQILISLVNASETVTLSEDVTLLLQSYINASETVTLTEAVTALLVSLISASETVTLSEAVNVTLVHTLAVSDTVTLSEDATLLLQSFAAASETITISEAITVLLTGLVSVSDTITLTESVNAILISFISASDTVTLSEDVNVTTVYNLSVSDTVTLSEAVTALLFAFVTASDTVTLSEAVNLLLTSFVSVSETITLSESVTVIIATSNDLNITVSDDINLTESTSFLMTSFISVTESIVISESLTFLVQSFVSVSDLITLAETTNQTLVNNVSVSDLVTLSEDVLLLDILNISASETITLSEALNLLLTSFINASDTVTLSEALTLLLQSFISVSDTVTLSEAVSLLNIFNLSVSDLITLTEAQQLALGIQVSASDLITLTESVNLAVITFGTLSINVSDTITLTESQTVSIAGIAIVGIVTLTFSTLQPGISFTFKQPTIDFEE